MLGAKILTNCHSFEDAVNRQRCYDDEASDLRQELPLLGLFVQRRLLRGGDSLVLGHREAVVTVAVADGSITIVVGMAERMKVFF